MPSHRCHPPSGFRPDHLSLRVSRRPRSRKHQRRGKPMRISRRLAIGATVLALMLSACGSGGGSKPTIKIGSDGFYEAKLMAEIYGQALEAKGYTVDRTGIGIGARKVSAPALESGQFDLKPEYIGSGLAFYEPGKQTGDPAANATELQ